MERLAALPTSLKIELGEKLYGIYVGPGGVPDLDEMGHLRGRPLPSGRGVWDDCGGAYLHRSIILGDRPTPTPDVVMHEVGHALDDIRGAGPALVSDSPVWGAIYEICVPKMVMPVHRSPGPVGRQEFFADAFACLAGRATVDLLDWLTGDRELVLLVEAFFRQKFGLVDGW
ncbi:hypothetical protein ACFY4C_39570 [Actinomadura viridis]|uniref:hypothetical protein n=1 Tax=Actinomadura viridis TaxID=58110 RepID=UPI00369DCFC9